MTVKVVVGDLLEATEDLLIHSVNCKGKMNSGIAKSIRQKYPEVFESYIKYYESVFPNDEVNLLGKVDVCKTHDGKYIASLFGQLNYGYDGQRYTSYDALYDGLEHIKNVCKDNGLSVALPAKIGSDRGGANWKVVYTVIEEIFKDYEVTIYQLEDK